MQQYIKNITSILVDRLSSEQLYYAPSDLIDAGFPSFLVQRIQLDLQKNLAESVKLPESDWADMKADPVQDAWDNFLLAIRAETRIPSSFLMSVTENAVEDVLELLSQPRKAVLETLFRSNEVCQLEELQARRKWIVINSILADALIRYLQRKGLSEISKEKAHFVIKETDNLICNGFSPLKWAQHLEPWYDLMGKQIPSEPLMLFYLDKEMKSVARQFEMGPETLTRNQLIEVLSTTDFDFEDTDTTEPVMEAIEPEREATLFTDASNWAGEEETENEALDSVHTESEQELPFELDEVETLDTITDLPFDLDIADSAEGIQKNDETDIQLPFDMDEIEIEELPASTDEKQEDVPIWQRFVPEGEESEEPLEIINEELEDAEDKILSIADALAMDEVSDVDENDDKDTILSIADALKISDKDELDEEVEDDSPSNILGSYSNFSSTEEEFLPHQRYRSLVGLNDSQYDLEPIENEESDNDDVIYLSDEAKALLNHLVDYKDDYVDEIFRGDERAFYVQIGEISIYKSWMMAGKYITRDIFDKNRVDLYSDIAVLFTDAVQEYFVKKEN